jgi:hypothetical protein
MSLFQHFLSSKMEVAAEDWELQLAAELPKIELHLHLDGSLSPGSGL